MTDPALSDIMNIQSPRGLASSPRTIGSQGSRSRQTAKAVVGGLCTAITALLCIPGVAERHKDVIYVHADDAFSVLPLLVADNVIC